MRCKEVYSLMQEYLDGAVTPEQERQVEAHIRACPRCRSRLVRLAQTANRLADGNRATAGNDLVRRVLTRLGTGERDRTPKGSSDGNERR